MGCSPSVVMASSTTHTAGVPDTQPPDAPRKHIRTGAQSSMSWTDPVELTDTQKKLVSKTMSSLRPKLNEFGVHVFKTIFQMRPDLKKHFGFEHQSDEDLEYNVNFRAHASRFMSVVDCAIQAIAEKNDAEATKVFHNMGAQHLQVSGFSRSNFSVFKEALLHCMEERVGQDKFKGELFRAWDLVVKFIIQRLQDGYMAAKAGREDIDNLSPTIDNHHDQKHIHLHLDNGNDQDGSLGVRNS